MCEREKEVSGDFHVWKELMTKQQASAGTNMVEIKKGSWSPEEDRKLVSYITNHGIWNWSQIPKFAGMYIYKHHLTLTQKNLVAVKNFLTWLQTNKIKVDSSTLQLY